ncbi:Multidrug efflux pump subunit AcrB [Bryocella elongata]|uniref:Multidrug efflux pump subunit AcrB n=1 Tax=Bryocella elongata TaxID=863522 RepID=A0A1H5T3P8_9BACT|nr:efflux RND transporter permease subunit [Bryocella elongata]SEF57374.1 Multidrug efflux pump subunit AcrB [Bryocella elongata]
MMWLVRVALQRPYTFIVMSLLIAGLGISSVFTMPIDIFPPINIPVVSVIWTYNGISPDDMANRIVTISERAMTTTVNDIEHIESRSYAGVAVIRVYFQPTANVEMGVAQVTAVSQTLLRQFPPGTFPPLIVKYDASSVPILQLGIDSNTLTEQQLADYAQNFIRVDLSSVPGAAVPLPYGGKTRSIMVDANPQAMYAYRVSASDISSALTNQSPILPAGTIKMGTKEYLVRTNSSPSVVQEFNMIPVKSIDGATVYLKDVAHVRDGFQVQTNIVRQDGQRGALLTVLKNGSTSTLSIVSNVRERLPLILAGLPKTLQIKPIFDQSVFVRAAVSDVVREASIAAALTGVMILLFLGSLRSTMIVCISIPLSILSSILILHTLGETINVMTLGGLALAVGILVDDATVEIENTNRNIAMKKPIVKAILDGAEEIATPTLIATLSICIVFIPVFLLSGAAKFLFTPLAMAVVFAMLTSYFLTRTLVPTLMHYLMKPEVPRIERPEDAPARPGDGRIWKTHKAFNHRFEEGRGKYLELLRWCTQHRASFIAIYGAIVLASLLLVLVVGRDFFPSVDAGEIRLHLRAPAGTRIEETEVLFGNVEGEIRKIIPADKLDTILDNIGLPASGINLAFSDTATVGDGDGDILIAMKDGQPSAAYEPLIRNMLRKKFPDCVEFFQPADITTQILNFGLAAPIDVQVGGRDNDGDYKIAKAIRDDISRLPGTTDVNVFQEPNYPEVDVAVDRVKAQQAGLTQRDVVGSMLVSLSASGQLSPNQWVDPKNGVSYPILVQTPQYKLDSMSDLSQTPITSSSGSPYTAVPRAGTLQAPSGGSLAYGNPGAVNNSTELLGNLATFQRSVSLEAIDHYSIRPVYDVLVTPDRRDLGSVASAVQEIIQRHRAQLPGGSTITLRGQVQTMNDSFTRLGIGILCAMMLVYLLMAVNFQSWVDPLIVLSTIPSALAGILWMLFLTRTTLSVPSLMGTLMTIGVATSNAILVVTFANDEQTAGKLPLEAAVSAGHVRMRPVIMTATAMILGMLPMALAFGQGGEQNAPLGRAVIGGLLFVTVSNLLFVPVVYSYLRTTPPVNFEKLIEAEAEGLAP